MANKQDVPAEEQVSAAPAAEPAAAVTMLSYEEIAAEVKPLSKVSFLAFWQRIGRALKGWWNGFSDRHPKGSKLLSQFVVMFVFSNLVTIWQFIVMAFLPYAFAGTWGTAFVWPAVKLPGVLDPAGNQLFYAIFNEPVQYNSAGEIIAGGLGNFIAFEIAVFTAQCINFPLQRNVTFRSNGNPVVQAIWYVIGWVLISVFVNAIWGIIQPFATSWGWNEHAAVAVQLLKTVITGGVSMIIFFFIFLIIFPDMNKVAKKERAKLEKLKSENAPAARIAAVELSVIRKEEEAKLANARTAKFKSLSRAKSKSMAYDVHLQKIAETKREVAYFAWLEQYYKDYITKLGGDITPESENKRKLDQLAQKAAEKKNKVALLESNTEKYQLAASEAIHAKREALAVYDNVVAEIKAVRSSRYESIKNVR